MTRHDRHVAFLTSDSNDSLLHDYADLMSGFGVRITLAGSLPRGDSPVFLTTMPDLDSFHVSRPKSSTRVYASCSMNSIHPANRPEAFADYDPFSRTGSHDKAERASCLARIDRQSVEL
jgi:hypothetical protein